MPSLRARLLNALLRRTVKPLWQPGLTVDAIRRHTARSDAWLGRGRLDCPTEAVTIDGVPARWFGEHALAARNGTLLYLHGGAWCVHVPALYSRFAARLSAATGLRVLLVDYRLAPEHPFPAAVDDCFAVYRALCADGTRPAGMRDRALSGDRPHARQPVDALQRRGGPDVRPGRGRPAAVPVLPGCRVGAAVDLAAERRLVRPAPAVLRRRLH
jgi:acetyl esterase/lipase